MNLEVYKPFKYLTISQKWNNPNASYDQFGFHNHNGVDMIYGYANAQESFSPKTWPVYCPVAGFVVKKVDYAPNGGGNEMWLLSKQRLQMGERLCYAYMPLCHADKILVPAGYEPALGELIMIGDNTGFSTGSHTHMGLYRVEWDGANMTFLDQNDANGSYDPTLFFNGKYAVDEATLPTLIKSNLRYYQYKIGL